jgi:hypothetical protein
MLSKRIQRLLLVCSSFLILSTAGAEPGPSPQPTPFQTPTPPEVSPGVNAEESIPVVISYGQNQETRVQVYRGLMEPAGVPTEQSVTVTLLLSSSYAGQIVKLGLYDGGQVGAVTVPGGDIVTFRDPGVGLPVVSLDGSVQFNFKAGVTFGLYRVLVTVGPTQFLLQFYAVRPRPVGEPVVLPTPPQPQPTTTPPT